MGVKWGKDKVKDKDKSKDKDKDNDKDKDKDNMEEMPPTDTAVPWIASLHLSVFVQ